jgi:DNA-binding IclR family transcriptional regulator
MYGSKSEKRKRIEKIAALVALAPQGMTRAALARVLGVVPSTVADDLVTLERLGVLLAEDEQGRLMLFRQRSSTRCREQPKKTQRMPQE